MIKVDYYFGLRRKEVFGIQRYKEELYNHTLQKMVDKKRIEYSMPKIPKISRILNFFDFVTYSPLTTLKERRKDAIAHILSHSEAYLLHYFKFKRSVVTCYDLIPYLFKTGNFLARKKVNYAFKGMLKADRIIAISEFTKHEIVKHLHYPKEKISVAYPAVNHSIYKPVNKKMQEEVIKKYNLNPENKYILYIGNEEPRMNIPNILKAFKDLKKKIPNAKLLKVGNPNFPGMREKLIALIKQMGLEKDVIFTNYTPEEEMPAFYTFADVFVYPIFYTGFGMPPLESMACGTPAITSDISVLKEVVGDAGVTVNPHNYKELSYQIINILNDKKLYRKLSKQGLNRAKKFSWENCAKQTMEAYEILL